MATITEVKNLIDSYIKTNGRNEISGNVLNNVMNELLKFSDSGQTANSNNIKAQLSSLNRELQNKLNIEDGDLYLGLNNMSVNPNDEFLYELKQYDSVLSEYFSSISNALAKLSSIVEKKDFSLLFNGVKETGTVQLSSVQEPDGVYYLKSSNLFVALKDGNLYQNWLGNAKYKSQIEYNSNIKKLYRNEMGDLFIKSFNSIQKASLSNCTNSEKLNFAIKELWIDDNENQPYVTRLFKNRNVNGVYTTQLTISQIDGTIDCEYYSNVQDLHPNSLVKLTERDGGKTGYAVVDWEVVDDEYFLNNENRVGVVSELSMCDFNLPHFPAIYAYMLNKGEIS